eukprot:4987548-Pleurochrysis_carterae.AAC.3
MIAARADSAAVRRLCFCPFRPLPVEPRVSAPDRRASGAWPVQSGLHHRPLCVRPLHHRPARGGREGQLRGAARKHHRPLPEAHRTAAAAALGGRRAYRHRQSARF